MIRDVMDRFLASVTCAEHWIWHNRWGSFVVNQRSTTARRAAWTLFRGAPPAGQLVFAACGVSSCVRPDHLELRTWSADCLRRAPTRDTARGERAGGAKLTETEVVTIRELYASGEWTLHALASRFGVCHGTIHQITRGRTWRSADGPIASLKLLRGPKTASGPGGAVVSSAEGARKLDCVAYGDCLLVAAKRGWRTFSCGSCPRAGEAGEDRRDKLVEIALRRSSRQNVDAPDLTGIARRRRAV